ncbi:MAG: four helix bundle protein [Verrucomicrobia bacterium]|nr:four helix bundle protein [Verrucomicrobiota bacterium]
MTYSRFEDLPVWQEAVRLAKQVYDLTGRNQKRMSPSLRDQSERAALSVSNNIAEGFERGTTNELLAFLYIARGSAGEVRSMLCSLERRPGLADLKSEISNLKSTAESCSRQLRAWADSLQNSEIKGQRHLNDRTRSAAEQKRRAEAFQKELLNRLPANHPLRQQATASK